MAMGDALAAEYLKVGAVVIAHRFEFPDKTKAKYCVLLENYDPKRPNTIVALTTSNRRFRDRPWIIAIPPNTCGIATVSYLDCNNCWPLPTHELASSRKSQVSIHRPTARKHYRGYLSRSRGGTIDPRGIPSSHFRRISAMALHEPCHRLSKAARIGANSQ